MKKYSYALVGLVYRGYGVYKYEEIARYDNAEDAYDHMSRVQEDGICAGGMYYGYDVKLVESKKY